MNEQAITELVECKRALRVLPDRAAAGQLSGSAYAEEWRRLDERAREIAASLTAGELREAHERAGFAC